MSFIRPLFEYAAVVWHNTPRHEKYFNDLERLQIDAARTVTGTNRNASKQLLYSETGWENLSDRREKQRLILFFKIFNGIAPQHLIDTFMSYNQHTHEHYTRHQHNKRNILTRTESFRNSFFPHAIRLWNSLDNTIRNVDSLNIFKSKVDKLYPRVKKNYYYYFGDRKVNSLLASMRTKCSQLRSDLYANKLTVNDLCSCGLSETHFHYFFECMNYIVQRDQLYNDTLFLPRLSLSTVLNGHAECTVQQNMLMFEAVSRYIYATKRFF